jgi:hypothetical protein
MRRTDMTEPVFNARVTDLASRIYVDLVRDSAAKPDGGAKTPAEAERLARLSFKLSESFHRILDELNAENEPKNVGYTVQLDDIAKWNLPAGKT